MQKLWELPRRITPHPTMVEGMPGADSAFQPRRHQKSNGVSEPDEVIPLSELGIGTLSHHYEFRESSTRFRQAGIALQSGQTQRLQAMGFRFYLPDRLYFIASERSSLMVT